MPTPTGMLRKGDRIRHAESGITCVVLERLGNDRTYAVRVRREDWEQFPPSSGTSRDRRQLLITEAGYWIDGHGWEVL